MSSSTPGSGLSGDHRNSLTTHPSWASAQEIHRAQPLLTPAYTREMGVDDTPALMGGLLRIADGGTRIQLCVTFPV
ncbi:hypothetical protein ALMP_80660 [Streptomyces sp. A012304]|nr:hypothetical protein ALMP_80660 [Streptomyces sp. A012304]